MKTKKLIGLIAICALAVISLGSFFGLTRATINDIAGFDFKTVNEANYFNVDSYVLTNDQANEDLNFEINEDGEIYAKLNAKDRTDVTNIPIQTVTLEPGEYVFKSGARNTSKDTYGLVLKETEGTTVVTDGAVIYADKTFEIEEETTFTLYMFIEAGEKCDVTYTPILVEKGEKAKFYVYDLNIFDNED